MKLLITFQRRECPSAIADTCFAVLVGIYSLTWEHFQNVDQQVSRKLLHYNVFVFKEFAICF